MPFIKYFLGIVVSAYRDFKDRYDLVAPKMTALETVRKATGYKLGRFTKQDIRELCPFLSESSIESALRKMVSSGELKKFGSTKSTEYIRQLM